MKVDLSSKKLSVRVGFWILGGGVSRMGRGLCVRIY